MAAKPRTTYELTHTTNGHELYVARASGFPAFRVARGDTRIYQHYHSALEEVAVLQLAPTTYDDFKLLFSQWWEATAPWENIAYDIIVYDRFGRPLGATMEHKPLVARRRMRELAEAVNGARGVVLRRNKRTLEVKQVAGFKRRTRRCAAATP